MAAPCSGDVRFAGVTCCRMW